MMNTIVSSSGDHTVRLWNAETGECIRTMSGHSDSVLSASFSPEGKTIVSSSCDKQCDCGMQRRENAFAR